MCCFSTGGNGSCLGWSGEAATAAESACPVLIMDAAMVEIDCRIEQRVE